MHVGGARTALYAWLYARKHGGSFILRIEDTDKEREVEGAIGNLMESLKWLGIKWDESIDVGGPHEPYIQSERLPIYKKYVEQLLEAGFAYPDPYTERDMEAFRKEAEMAKKPFLFREHRPARVQEWNGLSPVRFKTPLIKRYEWDDVVLGKLSAGEEALDDFILLKGDGYPTYNFAHVVDDIEMEVTHVMRGHEFVASTPKFLSLYDALDQPRPIFATLPPILGKDGTKKLSKRDGAKGLLDYRDDGYLPEAMVNFLALLGWHPSGNEEVFTAQELMTEFSLERVQKSGAQFDTEKLNYLNREHMRKLSDDEFVKKANLKVPDAARLRRAVPTIRERAYTLVEAREMLADELSGIFTTPELDMSQLLAKGEQNAAKSHLEALKALLEPLHEDIGAEEAKAALMPYADGIAKEDGGRGAALWPLRYALSGREKSPDPFTLIHILGKAESMSRIQSSIDILTV
ncbi:MAG: glutamyl-tRNA synthetase [Candidatus Parcubacteria bacterium]|jgi:glutamyl-tRNA synthetase|nr:glutamyl-tRNA synthetase [Candidatus Parcubacteria bacterium]